MTDRGLVALCFVPLIVPAMMLIYALLWRLPHDHK